MIFYAKNGIVYRTIDNKEELPQIIKLISHHFVTDLPSCKSQNVPFFAVYDGFIEVGERVLSQGMCIGAFDENTGETVAGVISNDLFGEPRLDFMELFKSRSYDSDLQIMDFALQELIKEEVLIPEEKHYCNYYLLSVSEKYKKRGIASELSKIAEVLARNNGFKKMYIELFTKEVKGLILGKQGYKAVKDIPLYSFEYEGKRAFEGIEQYEIPREERLSMTIALKDL